MRQNKRNSLSAFPGETFGKKPPRYIVASFAFRTFVMAISRVFLRSDGAIIARERVAGKGAGKEISRARGPTRCSAQAGEG